MTNESDEALLAEIAGFLKYRHEGGDMCFAMWADGRQFEGRARAVLEAAYMGATLLTEERSRWA